MNGFQGLDGTLAAVASRPGAEISGMAAVGVSDRDVVYEGYFGHRAFDGSGRVGLLPVDRETRFRVASISKPVTGLGVLRLVERGLLDLDADLSGPLGFPLRNPHHPGESITARMLLSHTSSLRDAGFYFPPLPHGIAELFLPGGRYYEDGAHFAQDVPGLRYSYCNLGYGILATCIERITGRRFDLYMRDEVLSPLGIDGGYNVNLLSDAGFANLAPLYRKSPGEDGPWDPEGPWLPQVDDYRGVRPALPVRVGETETGSAPRLEDYVPGTNGALFSPQGGLRITALDLSKVLRLLMGDGSFRGTRLLPARTLEAMTTARWEYDPARDGGEPPGFTRATGLALVRTGTVPAAGGGARLWGHHGDAYGLLGGMFFLPAEGIGFLYLMGGTSLSAEGHRDQEAEVQVRMLEALRRGRG